MRRPQPRTRAAVFVMNADQQRTNEYGPRAFVGETIYRAAIWSFFEIANLGRRLGPALFREMMPTAMAMIEEERFAGRNG